MVDKPTTVETLLAMGAVDSAIEAMADIAAIQAQLNKIEDPDKINDPVFLEVLLQTIRAANGAFSSLDQAALQTELLSSLQNSKSKS